LTRGEPSVTDVRPAPEWSDQDLLALAAAVEMNSEHPLGEAIVRGARDRGLSGAALVEGFAALPGLGVEAQVDGREVLLGNRRLMQERHVGLGLLDAAAEALEHDGKTVMFVAAHGRPAGLIAVADTLKEHSADAIRMLRQLGLETMMITGDNRRTAEAIGRQVGMDHVLAEVLPEDKAREVRTLQERGRRVVMVGDGINDAPALAQADVGMAIGTGTDVAKETGHVILIKDDLRDVVSAIEVARATMRKVRQNLFWAFVYNTITIPFAAGLLYPWSRQVVSPELAAFLMAISSLTVTMNTTLLKRFTPSLRRSDRAVNPTQTLAPAVRGAP
jgi:Cu+-exporting ATPase